MKIGQAHDEGYGRWKSKYLIYRILNEETQKVK